MANLYGEVMEHNTQLRRKLVDTEKTVKALKDRLSSELKRPSKTYALPEKCPVYVWVPSVIKKTDNSESYHVYQILVKVYKDEWNVYRRYSEFRDFHKAIQKDIPQLAQFSFPPKKALASKSPEILEDRRLRLQEFLRTVIRLCSQPKVVNGEKRNAFITPNITKSRLIRLLPFLTETVQTLPQSPEQVTVNHYSGL
jgi:sorting nexin-29